MNVLKKINNYILALMTSSSETFLCPVIDGAKQFKYYRAPAGFKEIRNKQKVAIIFGYVG